MSLAEIPPDPFSAHVQFLVRWDDFPWAALRVAGFALLGLLALLVVAYLPPTRSAVARWAEGRASQALDARVHIGSLSYDLARLRVTARDVRISEDRHDAPAWFEADEVSVDVPWSVLRGRLRFQAIELTRPRLNLHALETWLDARPKRDGKRIDRLDVERVVIRELAIAGYPDSAPFSIDIGQFSTESTSAAGRFTAPVQARGGSLRLGPYVTGLESIGGTVHYDGQRIVVEPAPRAHGLAGDSRPPGTSVCWARRLSWNLEVTLDGDVGPVLASWPEVPAAAREGPRHGPGDRPARHRPTGRPAGRGRTTRPRRRRGARGQGRHANLWRRRGGGGGVLRRRLAGTSKAG